MGYYIAGFPKVRDTFLGPHTRGYSILGVYVGGNSSYHIPVVYDMVWCCSQVKSLRRITNGV